MSAKAMEKVVEVVGKGVHFCDDCVKVCPYRGIVWDCDEKGGKSLLKRRFIFLCFTLTQLLATMDFATTIYWYGWEPNTENNFFYTIGFSMPSAFLLSSILVFVLLIIIIKILDDDYLRKFLLIAPSIIFSFNVLANGLNLVFSINGTFFLLALMGLLLLALKIIKKYSKEITTCPR